MRHPRTLLATFACSALLLVPTGSAGAAPAWKQVGTGITGGISGAAPTPSGWVVVRDNKSAGQNRIALLSRSGTLTPLTWPGTAPQDLESIAAVPNQPGTYAALTSTGNGSVVKIAGTKVTLVRTFKVPRGTSNVEGLALLRPGATTVATWATRGSPTAPATVFAATFNVSKGTFGAVVSGSVKVAYPTSNVRHVSDLTIANGRLRGSAASDPGDNGPFDSAIYDLGTVGLTSGKATLKLTAPRSLAKYPGHKVEGIACSGATGLLGSDDEKKGGWIIDSPALCS